MRQVPRRPRATVASSLLGAFLAAILLAALLLATAGLPAIAKEFMQATLDAPIAMGTPGGTEILVGMTVTVPDGDVMRPVEGSPIYLKLFGRDGSSTRASGVADREPGHYTMRILVPGGGARRAEVGIHGTTDLPIILMADPFTFGGITARTAQVAPALAPGITPFPRASDAPAAVPAAPAAPAPVETSPTSPFLVAVMLLAAVVVAAGLVLAVRRRTRAGARQDALRQA